MLKNQFPYDVILRRNGNKLGSRWNDLRTWCQNEVGYNWCYFEDDENVLFYFKDRTKALMFKLLWEVL